MSGISANRFARQHQTTEEILLAQWPAFPQKRWLRGQLGVAADTTAEHVETETTVAGIRSKWQDEIQPGKQANTLIEPYRGPKRSGLRFVNFNFRGLEGTEPVGGIPLSLYKNISPGDVAPYTDPATFDPAAFIGAKFDQNVVPYMFVPHAKFTGCELSDVSFPGSILDYIDARDSNVSRCSFRFSSMRANLTRCRLVRSDFRDVVLQDKTEFETDIVDCFFEACDFTRVIAKAVNFRRCRFFACNFSEFDAFDPNVSLAGANSADNQYRECVFDNAHMALSLDNDSLLLGCSAVGANLDGVINTFNVQYCRMDGASIQNPDFAGILRNNSFRYVTFETGVDFTGADVRGTDFTSSNLDSHVSRSAFKADVSAYDARTLWVDGTPL